MTLDPRELSAEAGLNRNRSSRRTQSKWVLRQDTKELGPDAEPNRNGSRGMTHHFLWILMQDQNWIRTQDPLVLYCDARPKRIGSGPSAPGSPNFLGLVVQPNPKLCLDVITRPNLPDIVLFGLYRPTDLFLIATHSPKIRLTN